MTWNYADINLPFRIRWWPDREFTKDWEFTEDWLALIDVKEWTA